MNTTHTKETMEIIRKLKAIGKRKVYYRKMWIDMDVIELGLRWRLNQLRPIVKNIVPKNKAK